MFITTHGPGVGLLTVAGLTCVSSFQLNHNDVAQCRQLCVYNTTASMGNLISLTVHLMTSNVQACMSESGF